MRHLEFPILQYKAEFLLSVTRTRRRRTTITTTTTTTAAAAATTTTTATTTYKLLDRDVHGENTISARFY